MPSISAKSTTPPRSSPENGRGEQCGDKVDPGDKQRWFVEPKSADYTNRQTVTALAMVELKVGNGKYRVWMLEYHREAEFFTSRLLDPGHFFQGRFHIGGKNKDKCHEYIQEVPDLLSGRFIPEENEVEVSFFFI
ncbi:hypothetical protein OESDEN_04519 [Oesophagostomum dentatum]|uniref:Uncharacterized protein n=1 Tax=Oesophagostomum dentatum TaxID=61180 RepID=A0A0B1TI89_OESDE|nr:hypothetical protein OESDEN_04519 [Oesophagostomum dentatum]